MEKQVLFVFGLALILLTNVASATTLVTGITYDSSYNPLEDVSIAVYCNSVSLDTNSGNGTVMSGGTYAVIFDTNCTEGSTVKVVGTKGSLSGEATGIVHACNETSCVADLMAIVNPFLSAPAPAPSSGGGGGGGGSSGYYYNCGNGVCNTGENAVTCPADCAVETIALSTNLTDLNQTEETPEEEVPEDQGFFSWITGAVTGVVNDSRFPIGVVIVILVGGITVVSIRNVKKKKASQ